MCKGCPDIRYDDRRQTAAKRPSTGTGKIGMESRWTQNGEKTCNIGNWERKWATGVNHGK
jgi:hypothetical protein